MTRVFTAVALALLLTSTARAGDERLDAARQLYARAAYEDALAALGPLTTASGDTALAAVEYRALCLFALGRTLEATAAARELVQKDPLYDFSGEDLPPRVATMFADAQKQALPAAARQRYRTAKAAIDSKNYAAAQSELDAVLQIVARARRLGVHDESLDDLAVLADGFQQIARANAGAVLPAAPVSAPVPTSEPVAPQPRVQRPAAPVRTRPYDAADPDVTPPITILQTVPPVPTSMEMTVRGKRAFLELTIGADGRVESATIQPPLNDAYDQMVISATKRWRYQPARVGGVAVPYQKVIGLAFPGQ